MSRIELAAKAIQKTKKTLLLMLFPGPRPYNNRVQCVQRKKTQFFLKNPGPKPTQTRVWRVRGKETEGMNMMVQSQQLKQNDSSESWIQTYVDLCMVCIKK